MTPLGEADVPSPCNGVCRMDAGSGWCVGCQRSLDEIVRWGAMDNTAKRDVWTLLAQRRASALETRP